MVANRLAYRCDNWFTAAVSHAVSHAAHEGAPADQLGSHGAIRPFEPAIAAAQRKPHLRPQVGEFGAVGPVERGVRESDREPPRASPDSAYRYVWRMKTALLGTGGMGAAIAARLAATDEDVTVWNRSADRAAPLSAAGVAVASSPEEAVRDAEIVLVMVSDATAVQAVLDRAGPALRDGACVVQMSTIAPEQVSGLTLPPGIRLVDAPVGGSVDAAREGRLTVLAGADAEALALATPVLEKLGTIRHCGPVGAGSALKLVLNSSLVTALASLADVLAVADSVGVSRETALDALSAGPLGAIIKRARSTTAHFPISLALKDIRLALAELGDRPAPVARAAAETFAGAKDQGADVGAVAGLD